MKCPNCGFENEKDAQYCNKCGKSMQENSKIYCSKCGNELKAGSKFCNKCGAKVKSRKISKFMNLKYFWIALPIAAILLIMSAYPDFLNYIDPTSSLNAKNIMYVQSNWWGTGCITLTFENLICILIMKYIATRKKFHGKVWNFIMGLFAIVYVLFLGKMCQVFNFGKYITWVLALLNLVCILITGYVVIKNNFYGKIWNFITGLFVIIYVLPFLGMFQYTDSVKVNIGFYSFIIVICIVVNLVIGCFSVFQFVNYGNKAKFSSLFWKKFNGILFAVFLVTISLYGFVKVETAIGGKSYCEQVEYNRGKKAVQDVKELKKIFNHCYLELDGREAVDYTNCNLHFVNDDGSKINFNDIKNFFGNEQQPGYEKDMITNYYVYMDNDDRYEYQDDVITDDAAYDVIGSYKRFKKFKGLECFEVTLDMTPAGKTKIEVNPFFGITRKFYLNSNGNSLSLNGILDLHNMDPTQASFTTAD